MSVAVKLLLLLKDEKVRKILFSVLAGIVVLFFVIFGLFNGLILSFVYLVRGNEIYYPLISTSRIAEPYNPNRIIERAYEEVKEKILYDPKTGLPKKDPVTGEIMKETWTETVIEKVESPHMGVDFESNEGMYVVASCGGTVTETYENDIDGKTVSIYHEELEHTTRYLHLDNIIVSVGDEVVLGQPIGKVGTTGDCTDDGEEDKPNVHFEILDKNGEYINPTSVLKNWGAYREIAVALIREVAGAEWEDWSYSDYADIEWNGEGFMWPLPGYTTLSCDFGQREDNHRGIDIPAPRGTPIYAAASGIVSTTAHWSYGTCVKISVSSELTTIYGHMDSRAEGITDGVHVEVGQLIGYVGNTGNSYGTNGGYHLHFEVNLNGIPVNPHSYFQ